ncbi:MAG TPA: hypothetical protein VMK53_02640 [Gemmatimonadales bacterium]|nr:hypothetical protein [Gemmatimonadales bacterium]
MPAASDPVQPRRPAPHRDSFTTSLVSHWLVRLGARTVVLGVSPILIYVVYERVTRLDGQNHEGFGILALVGLSLGVLLMLGGLLAVVVGRTRWRGPDPPK